MEQAAPGPVDVTAIRATLAEVVQRRRVQSRRVQWLAWENVGSRRHGDTATFDDLRPLLEREAAGLERLAAAMHDVLVQFALCRAMSAAGQRYDLSAVSHAMAALKEALRAYQGVPAMEFTALMALFEEHRGEYLAWLAEEEARLTQLRRTWYGRLAEASLVALPHRLARWRRRAGSSDVPPQVR